MRLQERGRIEILSSVDRVSFELVATYKRLIKDKLHYSRTRRTRAANCSALKITTMILLVQVIAAWDRPMLNLVLGNTSARFRCDKAWRHAPSDTRHSRAASLYICF